MYCSRFLVAVLGDFSAVNIGSVAFNGLRLVCILRFRLEDKRVDSDSSVVLLLRLRFSAVKHVCGFIKPHFCGLICCGFSSLRLKVLRLNLNPISAVLHFCGSSL